MHRTFSAVELSAEERSVIAWRREQLIRLGLSADEADLHSDLDWHELVRLLTGGCPLPTAIEILR